MKEILYIPCIITIITGKKKKVLWKRYRSELQAKCLKMLIEWMNVSRPVYLFLDSSTSPDFPFSVFPVSWTALSSPLLPLLAIQTSSLAPSSLFHHIKSITIFSWFYLLNSSHSYSSSGCFRACLYHHSIFLAGFLASTPLFPPNPFSEIVAKVISKRQI